MNARQLAKMGVPGFAMKAAIGGIQTWAKNHNHNQPRSYLKALIGLVLDNPRTYVADECFSELAKVLVEDSEYVRPAPVPYAIWGEDGIDQATRNQMEQACKLPVAAAAALMPDAHVGYGLPIGGVLALRNAVCPYAVGVDIACRMKLSVLDMEPALLNSRPALFEGALRGGTKFGVGQQYDRPKSHLVMDEDWTVTRTTREWKDRAWKQLGTSGSGNHFAEFGIVRVGVDNDLGLQPGSYVGLLSHSGSRGVGSAVCSTYSNIARANLPKRFEDVGQLAWLGLDTEAGQEYWAAMQLMGQYAAANHDVIHREVTRLLAADTLVVVENHHNYAWLVKSNDETLVVHRKGATPADLGILGVIPGSMGSPAYVVAGLGNATSLYSASHGAGRAMSRTQAKNTYNFKAVKNDLAAKGITILAAGADEVPMVYKPIEQVMAAQTDLVRVVGTFSPKMVLMSDDGKSED